MNTFVIFAYDIRSNKRRRKVAKLLESYGERVNYSVFELFIRPKQIDQIVKKVNEIIQPKTDIVLVYKLCKKCINNRIEMGRLYDQHSNSTLVIFQCFMLRLV